MPTLTIDNKQITVEQGTTILAAATALGIEIPTLCHYQGCTPQNSCLVCVVKVNGQRRLAPSCSAVAVEGMTVESDSATVRAARRTALELLLSDHAGDCVAPCQRVCPAHMDVPLMMRQIIAGDLDGALVTVKRDIPLPAVLGRICSAPCEAGCRHAAAGGALAVCLLKRFVADRDLAAAEPYVPPRRPATGKRVAIVGTGATGLTAAYYLQQLGHDCTLFDEHDQPGGRLRYDVSEEELPRDVLDGEIDVIRRLGVTFELSRRLGEHVALAELGRDYDAVLLAVGQVEPDAALKLGVATSAKGIAIDEATYQTSVAGVFAAGSAVRRTRLAVRNVADGKAAAACVEQYLAGALPAAPGRPFTVKMGRLEGAELARFIAAAGTAGADRTAPADGLKRGFTLEEAVNESARCLQCHCRCSGDCRLRRYAAAYGADPARYKGTPRLLSSERRLADVLFEPGKCIACGLCVQITERAGEPLGVAFVGRGFDVRIAVPFDHDIAAGLGRAAAECIAACPTGALTFADGKPSCAACGLGASCGDQGRG